VRRRRNGKARGRALPARGLGRLDGPSKCADLGTAWGLVVDWSTLGAVLLACFDDLSLPFSYVEAALELRAHGGVLGVEAGGEAGKAHVHDVGTAWARWPGGEGARRVDDVVVGEVQASGTVAGGGGGHVWRGRLLLDDYPRGWVGA
jgi:hypothetical protein